MVRKKTRQIKLGKVLIGGDAKISVQSMCNTKTEDYESTIKQIRELVAAGCDIVRVAVNNDNAIEALKKIRYELRDVPLVADIHFDYRLAVKSILSGVDGIRINPGNIGSNERVKEIIKTARDYNTVIRIGINSGSLPSDISNNSFSVVDAILTTSKRYIDLFLACGYENIKVSLKSSDVLETIEVYERFSESYDYPLHLGITEAGTLLSGAIKSSLGIGILLYKGIGDTIRVSLSAEPIYEVDVAKKILKALGLRRGGIDIISCPTCGRTNGDVIGISAELERRIQGIDKDIKVAIMGCEVNGPGEARSADLGVAFGKYDVIFFKNGKIIKKISKNEVIDILASEIQNF
ncbi:MAG: flavodoxin-dependent (E)-4-hydroxy-3-methylbut-2-enyl-diphosphate synthase [Deltaproteobacteria bacterium]|nr:flavodoxin-dependent (E)-4-hydroxy-3-methylbut-2-enyl-diphosphate synthase [Deltaproteobacteria bacterium]